MLGSSQLKKWEKPLQKVWSPTDKPIKPKYLHELLELVYSTLDLKYLWSLTDPVMRNYLSAWKWCYVYHFLLRDGHPITLQSQANDVAIAVRLSQYYGPYWEAQQQQASNGSQEVGFMPTCIASYCRFLAKKLQFHAAFDFVNSKMQLNDDEGFAADMNKCFQMCIDAMDLIADVLAIQSFISLELHQKRDGKKYELRMTPLLCLANECSALYNLIELGVCHMPAEVASIVDERFVSMSDSICNFYLALRQHDPTYEVPAVRRRRTSARPESHMYPTLPEPTAPSLSDLDY